jgi:hypothetical protein
MSGLTGGKCGLARAGAVSFLLVVLVLGLNACFASPAGANPGPADDDAFELPSVELLLERYIEAVGGREAILGLRDRVAEMHCVTDLEWDPPRHEVDTLTVYGRSSGEYLVVTRTQRGVIMEGFDGDEEWRIDSDGLVRHHAAGPRDHWMTDPQFPLQMRRYFPEMEVLHAGFWGDDMVFVVETDGEATHRLGFDVATGLLTRLGYHRELLDYREVDGVLMPMRVAYSRKGGSSTFIIDAVEHNTGIDRTIFSLSK